MTHANSTIGPTRESRGYDSPIFIAGPDRSGTTLMFGLLASHPNLSMTRRSNMWRYFYDRYGDLSFDENLDRCIHDMLHYKKMGHLEPDPAEIRREFEEGPSSYGRLFSIFHLQHARRSGKERWGEKSLHNEHFAESIFTEFPQARIIHMIRDPRDRYASVSRRHGQELSRVGAASGRWNRSIEVGLRNAKKYPDRYMFVRYEDLASKPTETLQAVCDFIGEPFDERMLQMQGTPDIRESGNSSFGDLGPRLISTKAIGRYPEVLDPEDIVFIQTVSKTGMKRFGYEPARVDRSELGFRYYSVRFLSSLARMWGWKALTRIRSWTGPQIPEEKILDEPLHASSSDNGQEYQ